MKISELTLTALLTSLILTIEVLAAKTGEILVVLTIFSTLPIYILARKKIKLGLLSYSIVGIVLFIINIHQLMFFLFTNGLIGLSLGTFDYYHRKSYLSVVITAVLCTLGLAITYTILGLNMLTLLSKISLFISTLIILGGMIIYCSFYRWFAGIIYRRVYKLLP